MRKTLREQVLKILCCTLGLGLSVSFFNGALAQVSGTYTINSALATGGTNFHSFTDAASFLSAGVNGPVVFNVQAGSGPYTEQVQLNNIGGTSAANTITFNCNGVTLKFLSTNTNQRAVIKLNNTSYVTFDNLTVTALGANYGEYGYGFHLLNNSDHNTIKNCRITVNMTEDDPGAMEGIVINGADDYATSEGNSNCDYNVIQNNTITGGTDGITLASIAASGSPVYMKSNQILNNTISKSYTACIQLYGNDGTIVDGNDVQGGPTSTVYDYRVYIYGIYLKDINLNCQITKNRIHNFYIAESGTFLFGILYRCQGVSGNPNLIANNLVYDFSSDWSQFGIAMRYGLTSFANIYNNTVALEDQTNVGSETGGLFFEKVTDVNVLNNIIVITRQTDNWNDAVMMENIPTRFVSDRNVYYMDLNSANDVGVGSYNGARRDNMLDWKKISGVDRHSVNLDPQFVNAFAFNFKPTAQPIDNMALWENITTDLAGVTRSTLNPDPGCYEFVTAACQTPVVPGTNDIFPDTVACEGTTVSFGLDGNSWGVGQTYTWQTSSTLNGTYTDVTAPVAYPAYDIVAATTKYYRVKVTCLLSTDYTVPTSVTVNPLLRAGTYTINSALPTGGSNFRSFSDATLAMQCGITGSVVFNVTPGSGPYNEQALFPEINTSPSSTITINGNGATIQFAASDSTQRAVIKLNGTDYVTIDSLNIMANGASYGFGVQMLNASTHNTIKRCKITLSTTAIDMGYTGIVIGGSDKSAIDAGVRSYCDSNLITHDTIIGGYYGIVAASLGFPAAAQTPGLQLTHNVLHDQFAYGMYITGTSGLLIEGNDISQPTRAASSSTSYVGIELNADNTGLNITRNRIHNILTLSKTATLQAQGIEFNKVPGFITAFNVCTNNEIYKFGGNGLQNGINFLNSNYLKVYHNTISLDDTTASFTTNTRGIVFNNNVTILGSEFKNNNIVIKRTGTGVRTGISMVGSGGSAPKSDYNNIYVVPADGTGTNGTSYVGSISGGNYKTLSDWWAMKKDSNSLSMDPVFQSIDSGNLTPTVIPFENKGIWASILVDVNDSTRALVKPDVGAVEFTICWPLETPVMTIDSVGVSAIRFRWTPVTYTPGYLVSHDGINWTTPSSGKLGLTHTISGLHARDTVGLMVKAIGTRWDCPVVYSNRVLGQTLTDQIFIPNTFTPNNNGTNDKFQVYSNIVQTLRLVIYNQWGEKVFETSDVNGAWDGTYKGKPAPIGIYVYVAVMTTSEPEIPNVTRKGTFNLIR